LSVFERLKALPERAAERVSPSRRGAIEAPAPVDLGRRVAFGVSAEREAERATGDDQPDDPGQRDGRERKLNQLVPPEAAIRTDQACRDENGGRHAVPLQQRPGDVQVIDVAVVEGNRDRTLGQCAAFKMSQQVAQREHVGPTTEDVEVRREVFGPHAEIPGVEGRLADAVVEQDDGPGRRAAQSPEPAPGRSKNRFHGATGAFRARTVTTTSYCGSRKSRSSWVSSQAATP